jgi:hypothetical protein
LKEVEKHLLRGKRLHCMALSKNAVTFYGKTLFIPSQNSTLKVSLKVFYCLYAFPIHINLVVNKNLKCKNETQGYNRILHIAVEVLITLFASIGIC